MNEIESLYSRITGGTPSILMVDDDPRILETVKDIFEEEGYEVSTAGDGASALKSLESNAFNVVVVDFQLPDATGLELARQIRERNEFTCVILMTGHASLEMAVKAIQEAVYDYLIKPVDPAVLHKTIQKAIEKQRLTLENRQLVEDLRRTNEAITRLNALKSKMLTVMSHDLRTPLSSIRGYSELLKSGVKGKLSENQKNMLEITIQEADHLNGLIGELLDMANIDSGRLNLETKTTPFSTVVDKALARVKLTSEMKEVPIEVILGSDLPMVTVDLPRLVQVVSNLLRASLKHSGRGSRIFVNANEKNKQIELKIAYSGQGFTPEEMKTIFVADKAPDEPKGTRDGLRITLAIAREIIHAHGGELGVDSRGPEHGAAFWIRLPITQIASE